MSDPIHFQVTQTNGVTILALTDVKLSDIKIVSELEDELLAFLDSHQPKQVLVDFHEVTRCSTTVINGLLRAKKRLLGVGGTLRLCGMRKSIREAFRILNLDGTVFPIFDAREVALQKWDG